MAPANFATCHFKNMASLLHHTHTSCCHLPSSVAMARCIVDWVGAPTILPITYGEMRKLVYYNVELVFFFFFFQGGRFNFQINITNLAPIKWAPDYDETPHTHDGGHVLLHGPQSQVWWICDHVHVATSSTSEVINQSSGTLIRVKWTTNINGRHVHSLVKTQSTTLEYTNYFLQLI